MRALQTVVLGLLLAGHAVAGSAPSVPGIPASVLGKPSGPVQFDPQGSPMPAQIGGALVGVAGAAGSPYAGFVLSGGDDFAGVMSLVGPSTPLARYFTTRAYPQPGLSAGATAGSGPRNAMGLMGYDADPLHAGYLDSNHGASVPGYYDLITQTPGILTLKSRDATTTELPYSQALQALESSMIHTAGYIVGVPPFIEEAMVRFPVNPGIGWHPSVWSMQTGGVNLDTGAGLNGVESVNGQETDWEAFPNNNAICPNRYAWAAGASTQVTGPGVTCPQFDGGLHRLTIEQLPNDIYWLVDGIVARHDVVSTSPFGVRPVYLLATNHVTNDGGASPYTPASWATLGAGGATMEIHDFRWWHAVGSVHRTPQVAQPDIVLPWAGPWPATVTLPSKPTVWGDTTVTDTLEAIPNDGADPLVNNNASWNGLPAGWTTAKNGDGTITVTIPQPNRAGPFNMVRDGYKIGDTVAPQRFRIVVGPRLLTPSTLQVQPLATFRWNIANDCDTGSNKYTYTVSPIPTGFFQLQVSGVQSGLFAGQAAFGNAATTINLGCTDTTTGQTINEAVTLSPAVAGTGTPAPQFAGVPIIGSIDFDKLSSLTLSGSAITAAAGVDGTSYAATQATTALQPASTLINNRYAAVFNGTSQYMDWAQFIAGAASTIQGPHTVVVVAMINTDQTNALVDFATGTSGAQSQRSTVLMTAVGWAYRNGGANTINDAVVSGFQGTGKVHVAIGRNSVSIPGAGLTASQIALDLNPTTPGYAILATNLQVGTAPTTATIGARFGSTTSTYDGFAAAAVFRVIVYGGNLTEAQAKQVANWAQNNFNAGS